MDFIGNVIRNGIGGVNCGGLENDFVPGRAQELEISNLKVYIFLTSSIDKADKYVEQGMLTVTKGIRYDKNSMPYTYKEYKVTQKGFDMYRGRQCVSDYIKNKK